MNIKVRKQWIKTATQEGRGKPFTISASIGSERYRFLKDNGIHISTLVRETIDDLIKRQSDGEDIFKKEEGRFL